MIRNNTVEPAQDNMEGFFDVATNNSIPLDAVPGRDDDVVADRLRFAI